VEAVREEPARCVKRGSQCSTRAIYSSPESTSIYSSIRVISGCLRRFRGDPFPQKHCGSAAEYVVHKCSIATNAASMQPGCRSSLACHMSSEIAANSTFARSFVTYLSQFHIHVALRRVRILKIMEVMGMSQCWKSRNNSTFSTIAGVLPHE
jgi:hypothetical protein